MTCQCRAPKQDDQCAFFICEIDRLQIDFELDPVFFKSSQHFESGHHAQRAIEAPAIWNGIKVRSEQKCGCHCKRVLRSNLLVVFEIAPVALLPRNDRRCQEGRMIPRAVCAKRSEEHTSELQSLAYLVCRLL